MYKALYREYRPETFADIVGQSSIVQILKNQIRENRVSHAYLFSGTRGTGKTSMAKVFSKAVNCDSPVDGEPCGICLPCTQGEVDIIEIDAASNNSVDNIRDIRDNVRYTPSYGKYKIYIVDEVHMLSQGAFNALLKTLEEPPDHIIFILATTEAHKIPQTVLSRVQRFDFKKISQEDVEKRLAYVLKDKGISYEAEALGFIAMKSEGTLRDALSMLEKAISSGPVTYQQVVDSAGEIDSSRLTNLVDVLIHKNKLELMRNIQSIHESGRDIKRLVPDLIDYLRDVLLIHMEGQELLLGTPTQIEELTQISGQLPMEQTVHLLESLSELEAKIKYSPNARVMIESFFIREMSRGGAAASLDTEEIQQLQDKLEAMEQKLKQLEKNGSKPKEKILQALEEKTDRVKMPYFDDIANQVNLSQEEKDALEGIKARMEEVYAGLQKMKNSHIKALLQDGEPVRYMEGRLYFGYEDNNALLQKMIDTDNNKQILSELFTKVLQKDIRVFFIAKREISTIQPSEEDQNEEIIKNIKEIFPDTPIQVFENKEDYNK